MANQVVFRLYPYQCDDDPADLLHSAAVAFATEDRDRRARCLAYCLQSIANMTYYENLSVENAINVMTKQNEDWGVYDE